MRLIDFFIPEQILLRADLDELRRARLTVVACYIGAAGLLWGVYFHVSSFGMTILPYVVAPAAAMALAAPVVLRLTSSLTLAANLLIGGSVIALCLVDLLSGGTSFGAISVSAMLPLFAVMLSGTGWGLIWGAVVLLHYGILIYMHSAGIAAPYSIAPELAHRAVVVNAPISMIIGLVAGITYDSLRRRAFREADRNWHRSEELKQRATQSEARYRALAELASDYTTFVIMKDGVPRLVWATDSVEGVTGYSWDELEQKDLRDLVHPRDRKSYEQQLASALEGMETESEYRIIHKDGSVRWLRTLGRLGQESEVGIGIYGASRDITAERKQASLLLQSQKMEVMGQLTGGVAHDFNNLLTVIIGNLELLRERVPEDRKVDALLNDAMRAAVDGGELVSNLLMFARQRAAAPAVLDLNEQIGGMRLLLERALGQSNTLELVLLPEPVSVLADRSQLQSAILNLCLNARDAMNAGGCVSISLDRTWFDDKHYALVRVEDDGSGMDAGDAAKARQPFFTTKPPGSGSGLGLSMVDGFVESVGGMLNIESELGIGTVVSMFLPIAARGSEFRPKAQPEAQDLPGGNELVLLVDDEVLIRRVARTLLESLGYRVLEAENAPAAQKVLNDHPEVALLFSDWIMPGNLDGYDLATWAVAKRPDLAVLLTTGYSERARGRTADQFPLLFKPYTRGDLAIQIRQVLDSNQAPQSAAHTGQKKTP